MLIWRGRHGRTAVIGVAVAAFIVCCVLPVGYLLLSVFGRPFTAAIVAFDARQQGLLVNTVLLGAGTAAFATAIGAPLGLVLARVPFRRKTLARLLAGAPLLMPPYVAGLAWVTVGRVWPASWTYSVPAAIGVLSLVFYPISMLTTEAAVRRVDGRLEEAGLIAASRGRVLRHITVPLIAPGIAAAALIIFVLAASEFGVPGLLRVRVYTTEVLTAFAALYDYPRAVALAWPLLALCIAVAAAAAALLRNRLVTTARTAHTSPMMFGLWRRQALTTMTLVVAIALVAPVLSLGFEAAGARSIAVTVAGASAAIAKSVVFSIIGATGVVMLATFLGYGIARARRVVREVAQAMLVVLFAVPGTIVGVGLIGVWNRSGPFGLVYGTDAMFLLAYLARFVPVAALILAATVQTVSPVQEEAAAVAGADWFRTFRGIVAPQMRSGLLAAWVITFVLAFGELGVSILVAPPGESTLPIRIYTLIANAPPSLVAALALLQCGVIFIPLAGLAAVIARRHPR